MVFGPVKKSSENVYIFLKTTKSLKIISKTEYKVIYLKITEAAIGGVL